MEMMNETECLLQSPANRERLLAAVRNVELGENLTTFDTLDDAIQYAEEQAAAI